MSEAFQHRKKKNIIATNAANGLHYALANKLDASSQKPLSPINVERHLKLKWFECIHSTIQFCVNDQFVLCTVFDTVSARHSFPSNCLSRKIHFHRFQFFVNGAAKKYVDLDLLRPTNRHSDKKRKNAEPPHFVEMCACERKPTLPEK